MMNRQAVLKLMDLSVRVEFEIRDFDHPASVAPPETVWASIAIFMSTNIPSMWDIYFPIGSVLVWKESEA